MLFVRTLTSLPQLLLLSKLGEWSGGVLVRLGDDWGRTAAFRVDADWHSSSGSYVCPVILSHPYSSHPVQYEHCIQNPG